MWIQLKREKTLFARMLSVYETEIFTCLYKKVSNSMEKKDSMMYYSCMRFESNTDRLTIRFKPSNPSELRNKVYLCHKSDITAQLIYYHVFYLRALGDLFNSSNCLHSEHSTNCWFEWAIYFDPFHYTSSIIQFVYTIFSVALLRSKKK